MPGTVLDNADTAVIDITRYKSLASQHLNFIEGKTEHKGVTYKPNDTLNKVGAEEKKALLIQSKKRDEVESLSILLYTGPGPNTVHGPE